MTTVFKELESFGQVLDRNAQARSKMRQILSDMRLIESIFFFYSLFIYMYYTSIWCPLIRGRRKLSLFINLKIFFSN